MYMFYIRCYKNDPDCRGKPEQVKILINCLKEIAYTQVEEIASFLTLNIPTQSFGCGWIYGVKV